KPALEVHLTDIRRRESWRRKSVIKDVCAAQVMGKGFDSYLIALQRFADGDLTGRKRAPASAPAPAARAAPAPAKAEKTIGRTPAAPAPAPVKDGKTIGRAPQASPAPAPVRDGKTIG